MSMEEKITYEMLLEEERRRKRRMIFTLVLGLVAGYALKTLATQHVTMGSDDYLVTKAETHAYNLNEMQRTVLANGGQAAVSDAVPTGGSCGQQ